MKSAILSREDQVAVLKFLGGKVGLQALKNGELRIVREEKLQKLKHVCDVAVHTQTDGNKLSKYFTLKEEGGLFYKISPGFQKDFLQKEITLPVQNQTLRCSDILVPYELLDAEKDLGGDAKMVTTLRDIIDLMLAHISGVNCKVFTGAECVLFYILNTKNEKQKALIKLNKVEKAFEAMNHLESGCPWYSLKRIVVCL